MQFKKMFGGEIRPGIKEAAVQVIPKLLLLFLLKLSPTHHRGVERRNGSSFVK
jgi:hypothetical protein